ncbi:GNAT family N-acetyltransferase [Dyadobacter sp. 32]|uniref:GNAT family N-acetyltransferase n=1 Tax=Dyadobacter sp. 32 TaxID=538966 RepID=UPI0011EDCDF3
MLINIHKSALEEVLHFRNQFLHENNFQFICNKCHDYGWADTYLFWANDMQIGYGAVWGTDRREDRDTIFEFFISPPFRKHTHLIFPKFATITKAIYIESQSNDVLLTSMLYEYATNIRAEAILFADHYQTNFDIPGTVFRPRQYDDNSDDSSDFFLEAEGRIVASGGLMLNYNFPYADIYMDVKAPFRQKGYGSVIVQEIKKVAYAAGRVPAARCNISNQISKATLLKAGLKICGFRLKGDLKALQ